VSSKTHVINDTIENGTPNQDLVSQAIGRSVVKSGHVHAALILCKYGILVSMFLS